MMLSSFLTHRAPATVAAIKSVVTPSLVAFPVATANLIQNTNTQQPSQPQQQQQVRWVTKKRQHRQAKRKRKAELAAKGIYPPKPNGYIPVDTPVINALSRKERDEEAKRQDEIAIQEVRARLDVVNSRRPLRFGFDEGDLVISDRVRKLLDLKNGNKREEAEAQKKSGMELFQLREGDTGSSAVQVMALTTRIQQIQAHMMQHKKDKHSKRGLEALLVRRRKLLDYMERKDFQSYRKVVKTLGL